MLARVKILLIGYWGVPNLHMGKIKKEEFRYIDLPKLYDFGTARNKEITLNKCFRKVNSDIDLLIQDLHGS